MYAGGISRGASFLIVDDKKAFHSLKNRLEFMADVVWSKFSLGRVRRWIEKVDEDRRLIHELMEGKVSGRIRDYIKTALLIVESPTKARTISRFFGRPCKRKIGSITVYEVATGRFILSIVASRGHIYDLTITDGFHGVRLIDGRFIPVYDFIKKCSSCGEQFTEFSACPKCGSTDFYSQRELVDVLRQISLEVNKVFIATDPDTEGEKIAYDILCSLHPLNKEIERLEFHEITKKAFLQAIRKRRGINERMVEAQIVRRVEDRWIGFELSQRLWNKFGNRSLSAGRAQTPVLGWIVKRTSEARRKKPVLYAKLSNGIRFSIESSVFDFPLKDFERRSKLLKASIEDVELEERKLNPAPPYTTDTLLKDASIKLGFSSSKTMKLAQDLFEMGLCTYHRTDSTTVSTSGINLAKRYIQERYPTKFAPRRYLKEGAHECIRPTRPLDAERLRRMISLGLLRFPKRLTDEHLGLYDIIFRRFIASQMIGVRLLYQKFKVRVGENEKVIEEPIKILDDGFNLIEPIRLGMPVKEGIYRIEEARILWFPSARPYSEGDLVSLMREKGIGRPSTYAKIISTLFEREYIIEKNGRLTNTLLGFKVYKYLQENFGRYVSEEMTRRLETQMSMVEEGKVDYQKVLNDLYKEIGSIRG